ncbi:MAG TPA: MT-A70 family methyltransferase [Candidatus Thermoplasmatota archaeon]|nr:MT-A70 family methyltransferase [Candidatus Thermoplasmatota archaeon]
MTWIQTVKGYKYIMDIQNGKRVYVKSLGKITKEQEQEQFAFHKEETAKLEKWKSEIKPMPTGPFDIIYADPPWRYNFSRSENRAIENQYPTMELKDICKLKIPSGDDSVLLLWATAPKLLEAFEVIKTWGFEYKTNLVWVKDKIGMGYYVRGRHELLLIAIKGKPKLPATIDRQDSVIFGPRKEHSEKPHSVYDFIESSYPDSKYIEIFARIKHSNKWDVWGNEI